MFQMNCVTVQTGLVLGVFRPEVYLQALLLLLAAPQPVCIIHLTLVYDRGRVS